MFTWGSKYLFAVGLVALLAAAVYGLVSGGDLIGVISAGYKGGIGDHTGYTILIAVGSMALGLGLTSLLTRDGDADAGASAVGAERALSVSTPRTPSYWAPLAAFGLACLVVGVAASRAFFALGLAVLAVVGLEWAVLAWSDRATGDEEVNRTIRNRVMGPFEIPLWSILGIAFVVLGLSRVLLTAPSAAASTAVASLAAAAVFGVAVGIAKSGASRSVITGVVAVGALAILAGGIAGAINGEREISHHGSEADSGDDHGGEGEGE